MCTLVHTNVVNLESKQLQIDINSDRPVLSSSNTRIFEPYSVYISARIKYKRRLTHGVDPSPAIATCHSEIDFDPKLLFLETQASYMSSVEPIIDDHCLNLSLVGVATDLSTVLGGVHCQEIIGFALTTQVLASVLNTDSCYNIVVPVVFNYKEVTGKSQPPVSAGCALVAHAMRPL
ncbi:hypothetical protein J6590_048916 [Homalodisca vitripennis]|nr:hypothetical protein J6590_048916 [Homalodisca vitripennis]